MKYDLYELDVDNFNDMRALELSFVTSGAQFSLVLLRPNHMLVQKHSPAKACSGCPSILQIPSDTDTFPISAPSSALQALLQHPHGDRFNVH